MLKFGSIKKLLSQWKSKRINGLIGFTVLLFRCLSTHGETRSISETAHPHKSGVNAWDFWGRFLITGGDDGAISITDLKHPASQVHNFPGRHSAQIAGLRALPCRKSSAQSSMDVEMSDFSIITASVDQRITLWSVTNCGQELSKVHEVRMAKISFEHLFTYLQYFCYIQAFNGRQLNVFVF